MVSSARQWWPLLARDPDALQRTHAHSRSVAASFERERKSPPPVVLIIAGTRPECIKLAPLVRRLAGLTNRTLLQRSIQMLYVQALLLGHHPLNAKEMALLNEGLIGLIEWGVQAEERGQA